MLLLTGFLNVVASPLEELLNAVAHLCLDDSRVPDRTRVQPSEAATLHWVEYLGIELFIAEQSVFAVFFLDTIHHIHLSPLVLPLLHSWFEPLDGHLSL